MFLDIGYSGSLFVDSGGQMKRALVALALFAWAASSMYLVWYTKYEIAGVCGFLALVVLNAYFRKPTLGGAA